MHVGDVFAREDDGVDVLAHERLVLDVGERHDRARQGYQERQHGEVFLEAALPRCRDDSVGRSTGKWPPVAKGFVVFAAFWHPDRYA